LPPSFVIDPIAGLDDLVGDTDDIEMPIVVKLKWKPIKKKVWLPRLRTRLLMLMNFETIYKYYFYS
jgi:hypothetical protein